MSATSRASPDSLPGCILSPPSYWGRPETPWKLHGKAAGLQPLSSHRHRTKVLSNVSHSVLISSGSFTAQHHRGCCVLIFHFSKRSTNLGGNWPPAGESNPSEAPVLSPASSSAPALSILEHPLLGPGFRPSRSFALESPSFALSQPESVSKAQNQGAPVDMCP